MSPPTNLPILFLNPQTKTAELQTQLQRLVWFNVPISLAIAVILYWLMPETGLWQLGIIVVLAHFVMMALVYGGYFKLAVYVLPLSFFVITVLGAQWTNDQQGLFVGFFGLAILVTSALLGSRATAVAILMSIIACATFFLQPHQPIWLPPYLSLILASFQLIVFGMVGHFTMRKLVFAFWEMQSTNDSLTSIQQQLREQQAALARSEQTKGKKRQ